MASLRTSASLCAGLCLVSFGIAAQAAAPQGPGPRGAGQAATAQPQPGDHIVAVVNGDVISAGDVAARARLFALSTGLPITPEVVARLRPQVTHF